MFGESTAMQLGSKETAPVPVNALGVDPVKGARPTR